MAERDQLIWKFLNKLKFDSSSITQDENKEKLLPLVFHVASKESRYDEPSIYAQAEVNRHN
jgi:hypothetical protein